MSEDMKVERVLISGEKPKMCELCLFYKHSSEFEGCIFDIREIENCLIEVESEEKNE